MAESTTTPTVQSKTFLAIAVSALSGLPVLVDQLQLLDLGLPPNVLKLLTLIAVVSGWLAPILARHAAVEAVQRVESVAEVAADAATVVAARVEAVANAAADALDPHTVTPEGTLETLRGTGQEEG